MRSSHLRMLNYDLRYLGTAEYDGDNLKSQPAMIIIDNETAMCMAKCNKDTAGKRHVARISIMSDKVQSSKNMSSNG